MLIRFLYIVLFFFVSFLHAGENDTVYPFYVNNNTMVDIYNNIFNGIVILLQNGTYLSILKITFLIGGFFVFMIGIFSILSKPTSDGKRVVFDFLKYMIYGVIVLSVLFSGKNAYLHIESKNLPSYCDTLSPASSDVMVNMPEVLAWTYSLLNRLGYNATEVMRSHFNLPNDTPDSYGGYLSAIGGVSNLLQLDIPKLTVNDVNATKISTEFSHFMNKCILEVAAYDSDGFQVLNTVLGSGDISRTIDKIETNTSSPALVYYKNPEDTSGTTISSEVKTDSGTEYKDIIIVDAGKTYSCGDYWNNVIKSNLDNLKSKDIECVPALKDVSKYAIGFFTPNTDLNNFRNIAVQAALMNASLETAAHEGIGFINYTAAKTLAEQAQMYIGQGIMMAHIIPYFQAALRAIMYAFFPFVFVVILLPRGLNILKNYILSLVWVEMWLPIMSIIMFMMSYVGERTLTAVYGKSFNNINLLSVFSDTAMLAGVMGYLMMFVPGIAWMILKASDAMISGMFSGLTAKFVANLSNVNAYNKDIARAEAVKEYNKKALLEGKKIVSMAEAEQMRIQKQTMMEYGTLGTLSEYNDKELLKIGSGNERAEIMKGLANNITKKQAEINSLIERTKLETLGDQTETEARKMGYGEALKEIYASKDMLNELQAYKDSHKKAVKTLAESKGISEDMAALELMSAEYATTRTMDHFKHDQALADLLDPSGKYQRKDGTFDWQKMIKDEHVIREINKMGHAEATKIREMMASIPAGVNKLITSLKTMKKGGLNDILIDGKKVSIDEVINRLSHIEKQASSKYLIDADSMNYIKKIESSLSGINEGIGTALNMSIVQNNELKDYANQAVSDIETESIKADILFNEIVKNHYVGTLETNKYLGIAKFKAHYQTPVDLYESLVKQSEYITLKKDFGIDADEKGKLEGASKSADMLGKGNAYDMLFKSLNYNKADIERTLFAMYLADNIEKIHLLSKILDKTGTKLTKFIAERYLKSQAGQYINYILKEKIDDIKVFKEKVKNEVGKKIEEGLSKTAKKLFSEEAYKKLEGLGIKKIGSFVESSFAKGIAKATGKIVLSDTGVGLVVGGALNGLGTSMDAYNRQVKKVHNLDEKTKENLKVSTFGSFVYEVGALKSGFLNYFRDLAVNAESFIVSGHFKEDFHLKKELIIKNVKFDKKNDVVHINATLHGILMKAESLYIDSISKKSLVEKIKNYVGSDKFAKNVEEINSAASELTNEVVNKNKFIKYSGLGMLNFTSIKNLADVIEARKNSSVQKKIEATINVIERTTKEVVNNLIDAGGIGGFLTPSAMKSEKLLTLDGLGGYSLNMLKVKAQYGENLPKDKFNEILREKNIQYDPHKKYIIVTIEHLSKPKTGVGFNKKEILGHEVIAMDKSEFELYKDSLNLYRSTRSAFKNSVLFDDLTDKDNVKFFFNEVNDEINGEQEYAKRYMEILSEMKNTKISIEEYNKYRKMSDSAEEAILRIYRDKLHIGDRINKIDDDFTENFLGNQDDSVSSTTYVAKSRALEMFISKKIDLTLINKTAKNESLTKMMNFINQ